MKKTDLDLTNPYHYQGYLWACEIIDALKRRRKFMGWTQKELAQKAGLSETTVSRLERHQFSTGYILSLAACAALEIYPQLTFGKLPDVY
jgi:transcriptional regulator with XRE-family HTH domain